MNIPNQERPSPSVLKSKTRLSPSVLKSKTRLSPSVLKSKTRLSPSVPRARQDESKCPQEQDKTESKCPQEQDKTESKCPPLGMSLGLKRDIAARAHQKPSTVRERLHTFRRICELAANCSGCRNAWQGTESPGNFLQNKKRIRLFPVFRRASLAALEFVKPSVVGMLLGGVAVLVGFTCLLGSLRESGS
ncbi:hypothetical protein WMY93_009973 [Mugilogobius chulae]|uniref:Uncharacterized protein n=1 Tax=Mugilogobius chulae TaxID=88201 RepID=A0AAW0P9S5_9GOBI